MSETITDDGSAPSTTKQFDNPDQDGIYPSRALPDAFEDGKEQLHVVDPTKAGEYLDIKDFEARQRDLKLMSDEDRTKVIEALNTETRAKWAREELEHLQELVKDQPVEGAEFKPDDPQEVKVDGAETPQDRAPDVGADLIAALVEERLGAEQKTAAAVKRAEEQEQLAIERAAEVDAYYQKFGPLPED